MYGTYLPKYNQRINIPSSFTIDIQGVQAGPKAFELAITVDKVASTTATNMVLHVVVTESDIAYNWQGQTILHNVERLMIPNQSGTPLDFSSGDQITQVVYFEMQPSWVVNNSQVIVFIQNTQNKEVLQGTNHDISDFTSFTIDASIRDLVIPQTVCENTLSPKITIANNGLDNLTSLDIVYDVNGGTPMTYSWTGNLASYESEIVVLNEIGFTLMDENTFTISCENPNGQIDQFPLNNIKIIDVPIAANVNSPVSLALKLDNYPNETTWEVLNSSGDVIYSGGPYSNPNQYLIESFVLNDIDCYTFVIYDAGGDGLTGLGSYKLVHQGSTIFAEGKDFGFEDHVQFGIGLVGVDEQPLVNHFLISPNPVDNETNISFTLETSEDVQMKVFNTVGKIVYETKLQSYSSGNHTINFFRDKLETGLYFIQLSIGEKLLTKKVIFK